jgi:glycosyltransferase involved in cell wall biosynthesis
MNEDRQGMLLVLPLPFRQVNGRVLCELQAGNGLERWADGFGSVTVIAPLMTEADARQDQTFVWRDTTTLREPHRFQFLLLPGAYTWVGFLFHYLVRRKELRARISSSRYLQFAISGLAGDWGAVAALEAKRQGRAYAIHSDTVAASVLWDASKTAGVGVRVRAKILSVLLLRYHQYLMKGARLGLLNGQDTFNTYRAFCPNSHLIHDLHTKASDQIGQAELREKIASAEQDACLRVVYAGRMEDLKAPLEWVRSIEMAVREGARIRATWIGSGSLFGEVSEYIRQKGLEPFIHLAGLEADRAVVLEKIRRAHVMAFTNKAKESPRCLLEALVSGTALAGYGSDYSRHLLKDYGGGLLTGRHDPSELAKLLLYLDQDRAALGRLIGEAARNGRRFTDEGVFRHRCELIKTHLN